NESARLAGNGRAVSGPESEWRPRVDARAGGRWRTTRTSRARPVARLDGLPARIPADAAGAPAHAPGRDAPADSRGLEAEHLPADHVVRRRGRRPSAI